METRGHGPRPGLGVSSILGPVPSRICSVLGPAPRVRPTRPRQVGRVSGRPVNLPGATITTVTDPSLTLSSLLLPGLQSLIPGFFTPFLNSARDSCLGPPPPRPHTPTVSSIWNPELNPPDPVPVPVPLTLPVFLRPNREGGDGTDTVNPTP